MIQDMNAWLILTVLAVLLPFQSKGKVSKAELREAGEELAELYRADQQDQNLWDQVEQSELEKRLRVRRARVVELVTEGKLGEPADYNHAAWLLQHGEGADDFLMAHLLATTAAFEEYEEARFMSAAALDRFAMIVGQTQRFGSQTFDEQGRDFGDTSGFLDDSIVALFRGQASGLKGKPVEPGARDKKVLKSAAKFLSKTAKRAPRFARSTDDKDISQWNAALEQTRAYVSAGSLAEAGAFHDAGVILSYGEDQDTLLLAHIMATSAGLLEHKKARELYARTIDRYLIALGRAPIFGTKVPEGVEVAELPEILTLHPRVRARILGKKR